MNVFWLKGESDKDKARTRVRASRWALDKIKEWAETRLDSVLSERESDYTNSAWAYRQAHRNGYAECLRDILSIVTLDKEDHSND